jgi:hypothetical protein
MKEKIMGNPLSNENNSVALPDPGMSMLGNNPPIATW